MLNLKIYAQLCDDISQACYPPYTITRSLPLIAGEITGVAADENEEISLKEISWSNTLSEGRIKAAGLEKNMFVLITAPSWCGPCQYMEKYTLPDPELIRLLNTSFVPVLVLDEIDGQTNQDLAEFDFSGYPSYLVLAPTGEILYQDVGAVNVMQLISGISAYSGEKNTHDENTYNENDS